MSDKLYEKRVGGLHVEMSAAQTNFSQAGDRSNVISLNTELVGELIAFLQGFEPEHAVERMGFRVPVSMFSTDVVEHELRVKLAINGVLRQVSPNDVSFSGISVHWESGDEAVPLIGAKVSFQLQRDKDNVTLLSTVTRIDGDLIAAAFDDAMCGSDLEPPEELRHIVRGLEADWLKQRRRLED